MLYSRIQDVSTAKPYPGPSGSPAATPTASAPAATPPPAPPAGSVTIPGFTPDYQNLITSDPGYVSAQSAATLAKSNAAAQRKAQLQRAIIQYGGLPAGFTDQYGDIDQATLDQAKNNQFSTLAQLAKGYSQSGDQLRRSLAARGALQSGDLNYGADQLDQAYGQQRYDAANATGNDLNSALGAYTGVLGSNAQSLAGAVQGAESNVYSNPAYAPTQASSANYDASNSATYGQPIYVDSSGNMYDVNGNPFKPPAPSASASAPQPDPYFGNIRTPGLQI